MTRFKSYLHYACAILVEYDGTIPFHSYIKQFFSGQKKFGSTDRRSITHLCYCYFRLGKAVGKMETEEAVLLGLLLSSNASHPILQALRPEWDSMAALGLNEKLSLLAKPFDVEDIFPWTNQLSTGIDANAFCRSFLHQPRLFLRTRPGRETAVTEKLKEANISFENLGEQSLALPASSKLDDVIRLNKEAVVQDLSSQRVAEFFPVLAPRSTVWDCCSGSGGKSILLYDTIPGIKLTVSDKRESILANLRTRFQEAGIQEYQSRVADLGKDELPGGISTPQFFDMILADVPCSGSGTWARTPEQLVFHQPSTIGNYQLLQRKIMQRVFPMLKKGGHLLYITCSVFKQENEDNMMWAEKEFGLQREKMNVITGYGAGADTMFAALLTL